MSEAQLFQLLRAKYPAEEYALLRSVPDGTGANKARTADALAMALWPSRGLEVTGFEMKASRNDWRAELKNPAKAEAFVRYCDRWYLVVTSADLVAAGELPPTWGLMAVDRGRLVVVEKAPKLQSQPLPREFIAGILRAAQGQSAAEKDLKAAMEAGHRAGVLAGRGELERELRKVRDELTAVNHKVRVFEEASGVHLPLYNGGRIGQFVKLLLAGGADQYGRELDQVVAKAEAIARAARAAQQEYEDIRQVAGRQEIA
jgi:hypothetical protein